jgi:vacuolar-type H+-ATPase subunit H
MIVIRAYTQLRETLKKLGEEENRSSEIEEARQRALEITEAVLYIKQHSINCISAAMYAMSCFDDLFPPEEAEQFARDLFVDSDQISKEDAEAIREHILSLYRQFLDQGQNSSSWEMPLLDFLASQPKK